MYYVWLCMWQIKLLNLEFWTFKCQLYTKHSVPEHHWLHSRAQQQSNIRAVNNLPEWGHIHSKKLLKYLEYADWNRDIFCNTCSRPWSCHNGLLEATLSSFFSLFLLKNPVHWFVFVFMDEAACFCPKIWQHQLPWSLVQNRKAAVKRRHLTGAEETRVGRSVLCVLHQNLRYSL